MIILIHVKPGQKIEKPIVHPSRGGMVVTSGIYREDARLNAIKKLKQ